MCVMLVCLHYACEQVGLESATGNSSRRWRPATLSFILFYFWFPCPVQMMDLTPGLPAQYFIYFSRCGVCRGEARSSGQDLSWNSGCRNPAVWHSASYLTSQALVSSTRKWEWKETLSWVEDKTGVWYDNS